MDEKSQEELAQELADELSRAADNKRHEADILQQLAVQLDLKGASGFVKLLRKYQKIETEVDVLEEALEKSDIKTWD